jgi:hypothetical protein
MRSPTRPHVVPWLPTGATTRGYQIWYSRHNSTKREQRSMIPLSTKASPVLSPNAHLLLPATRYSRGRRVAGCQGKDLQLRDIHRRQQRLIRRSPPTDTFPVPPSHHPNRPATNHTFPTHPSPLLLNWEQRKLYDANVSQLCIIPPSFS